MLRLGLALRRVDQRRFDSSAGSRKAQVIQAQTECINQLVREVARIIVDNPEQLRGEYVDEIRANTRVETSVSASVALTVVSGEEALGALFEAEPAYLPDFVAVPIQDNVNLSQLAEFGGEFGIGGEGGSVLIGETRYLNVPPGQEGEFNNVHAGLYEQLERIGPNNRLRILIAYLPRHPIADIVRDRIESDYIGLCMRDRLR